MLRPRPPPKIDQKLVRETLPKPASLTIDLASWVRLVFVLAVLESTSSVFVQGVKLSCVSRCVSPCHFYHPWSQPPPWLLLSFFSSPSAVSQMIKSFADQLVEDYWLSVRAGSVFVMYKFSAQRERICTATLGLKREVVSPLLRSVLGRWIGYRAPVAEQRPANVVFHFSHFPCRDWIASLCRTRKQGGVFLALTPSEPIDCTPPFCDWMTTLHSALYAGSSQRFKLSVDPPRENAERKLPQNGSSSCL